MRLSVNAGLSLVVLAVMAAELFLPAEALEYRRALVLLGRLFADRLKSRAFFGILAAAPVLISLLFLVTMPELLWYRGLSGVLHALFFAGCVMWISTTARRARWLPIAALIGGTVKVLVEQPWDGSFPVHEVLRVAVVPQAHLIGAIVGTAAGLLLRYRLRPAAA